MATSTYTGAIYGTGTYGGASYGVSNVSNVPDGVQASATADTDIIISGDALHSVTSVVGTLANGGVGQVTAAGTASLASVSVEATGEVGTAEARSVNLIPVTGVSTTPGIGNVVVVAKATVSLSGISAAVSIGTAEGKAGSVNVPTGVSATGTVDENEVVFNNAVPTFTGVSSTASPGTLTISATRNVFAAADRIETRTVYIPEDTQRIVYIPEDKPRIVYVLAA